MKSTWKALQQIYQVAPAGEREADDRRLYQLAFVPKNPFFKSIVSTSALLAEQFRQNGHDVTFQLDGPGLGRYAEKGHVDLFSSIRIAEKLPAYASYPHMPLVHFWANVEEAIAAEAAVKQAMETHQINEVRTGVTHHSHHMPKFRYCNFSGLSGGPETDGFVAWVSVSREIELFAQQEAFRAAIKACTEHVVTPAGEKWGARFTLLVVENDPNVKDVNCSLRDSPVQPLTLVKGEVRLALSSIDGHLRFPFPHRGAVLEMSGRKPTTRAPVLAR